MKATLIISKEYHMNDSAVFAYAKENYYGCQVYPRSRNYPTDMNYWRSAICADADRFFTVIDVDYSAQDFARIEELQGNIFYDEKLLKKYDTSYIPCPKAAKNSKVYKDYLAQVEQQNNLNNEISAYNMPIEGRISQNREELRTLLLKPCRKDPINSNELEELKNELL